MRGSYPLISLLRHVWPPSRAPTCPARCARRSARNERIRPRGQVETTAAGETTTPCPRAPPLWAESRARTRPPRFALAARPLSPQASCRNQRCNLAEPRSAFLESNRRDRRKADERYGDERIARVDDAGRSQRHETDTLPRVYSDRSCGLDGVVSARGNVGDETAAQERQQPYRPTRPRLPVRPGDAALVAAGRPTPLATNS